MLQYATQLLLVFFHYMAGGHTLQHLYSREIAVDQRSGELRYESASPDVPVGQFIGPKPLSNKCNSFSIEIANPGARSFIAIGLCHRRYPANRQPGWEVNSIGYHADDGGIYHEAGHPRHKFGRVKIGEVMTCSVNYQTHEVTFERNGSHVFTSPPLRIPPGGFYPIVGLHSHGETVCLLEPQPWTQDVEASPEPERLVYHSLYAREVQVVHSQGVVRYNTMAPEVPVGQFISACPLSPMCNKFSIEIVCEGQARCIAIGVCHRRYPAQRQPGWLPNSIAYHADDGGIFHGQGRPIGHARNAKVGDTMSCELEFRTSTVMFYHNDTLVYKSPPLRIPPGGFHAAVGFHSHGESVCLLERDPWKSAEEQLLPPPVAVKYHYTTCLVANLNEKTGVLGFAGGKSEASVAQLISKCPLTPEINSFSLEILSQGISCCIAIGLTGKHYPPNAQPGWLTHSIGYHADDGGLYCGAGHALESLPIARMSDIMTCQFNFTTSTVIFSNNQRKIFESRPLDVPTGGFHAAIGLHSEGETVRLLDSEPWRDEQQHQQQQQPQHQQQQQQQEQQQQRNSSVAQSTTTGPRTACGVCMDRPVSHFLIPCGHTYCAECIEEWSEIQKTCPTCRLEYQEAKPLFFG